MSETETTVPMDDKSLFESAVADVQETTQEATTETVTEAVQETATQTRDEHGRFAAKAEPEQAKVESKEQTDTAHVPSWRLAEVSEARRAAEARAAETERRASELERHVYQLTGQLKQYTEKPAEQIDPFSDPEKFTDSRAQRAVDPLRSEVGNTREFFSRKFAIKEHGEQTVSEAYKWLDESAKRGDPNAVSLVHRVKTSIDPFEEIVSAYKRDKALSTVGTDPNAWFDKELERRMADPEFAKKFGAPTAQTQAQSPNSVVRLPPSLNRAPGTAGNNQAASMDDKGLYAFATG